MPLSHLELYFEHGSTEQTNVGYLYSSVFHLLLLPQKFLSACTQKIELLRFWSLPWSTYLYLNPCLKCLASQTCLPCSFLRKSSKPTNAYIARIGESHFPLSKNYNSFYLLNHVKILHSDRIRSSCINRWWC